MNILFFEGGRLIVKGSLPLPEGGEEENENGGKLQTADDHFQSKQEFGRGIHPGKGTAGSHFSKAGPHIA